MNRYLVIDLKEDTIYNTNDLKYLVDDEFDRYGSSISCINKEDLINELDEELKYLKKEYLGTRYDEDENFEIDEEKANSINYLEHKGILAQYIYDTNTIIFSWANKETFKDSDDLDTMIYRNYSVADIKEIIDENIDEWLKLKEMN